MSTLDKVKYHNQFFKAGGISAHFPLPKVKKYSWQAGEQNVRVFEKPLPIGYQIRLFRGVSFKRD